MTCSIDRNRFKTELGKQVFDRLVSIYPNDDFIYSVLSDIMGDERKINFIKYLDETNVNDPDEILDYLDDLYAD